MLDPIKQKSTALELMILGITLMIYLCWVFSKPVMCAVGSAALPPSPSALPSTNARHNMGISKPKTKIIKALNGLRVLFISQVILNHFGPMPIRYFKSHWFQHQPMSFFAILSGFIRMHTMRAPAGYSFGMIRAYWARVLVRFGPPYWVALVWVGGWRDFERPFLAWPIQAIFLQACLPVQMDHARYGFFPLSANYVGWFTSCIVIASCSFPLLYNALHWLGAVHMRSRASAALTLLTLCRCLLIHFEVSDKNAYVRWLEFVLGVLSANFCSFFDPVAVLWAGWGWVFDSSLVMYYLMNAFADEFKITCQVLGQLIWLFLIISGWASVQSSDSHGEAMTGLLGRALSWRPISSLAEYSFGAYIYQLAVLYTVKYLHLRQYWWWMPLFGSWLVAMVSEHFFEKHARRFVDARICGQSSCA